MIAAGLALAAGALIGSYDLMIALQRDHYIAPVSAGSPPPPR